MKRVLILSYYYKHKNAMASVRAVKLAKYLAQNDCEVTVLTSSQKDTWTKKYEEPTPDENIREWYAPAVKRWLFIGKILEKRKARGMARADAAGGHTAPAAPGANKGWKSRAAAFMKWLFYFELSVQEDVCLYKGLRAEYRRQASPHYDAVIATYPSFGAFLMGIWLKKHHHCQTLIADFRDPLYNPGFRSRRAESNYDRRCLKRILNRADHVVCVSQGIADGMETEIARTPSRRLPISILTNGYDPEDTADLTPLCALDPEKLHFVYTGALYHGKRCVDMLAQILRSLIDEGHIAPDSFTFEYAGADYSELEAQLQPYGLANCAVNHGVVSREQSLALQKSGDALLLLTWNETSYRGVIPGKLFEYMAIGNQPILALITGNVGGSEVADIVRKAQAGFACEEAVAEDAENLKKYVLKLFRGEEKTETRSEQYDYRNIARRYRELL